MIAHIKIIECPYCYEQFNMAHRADPGETGRKEPAPGDPSICLNCGKISVFDEDMNARVPNEMEMDTYVGEMYSIMAQPEQKEQLARMIAMHRNGNAPPSEGR